MKNKEKNIDMYIIFFKTFFFSQNLPFVVVNKGQNTNTQCVLLNDQEIDEIAQRELDDDIPFFEKNKKKKSR
jgi:hypothetical protein